MSDHAHLANMGGYILIDSTVIEDDSVIREDSDVDVLSAPSVADCGGQGRLSLRQEMTRNVQAD